MKKKFRTVNIPEDWFERLEKIAAHQNRTIGMQLREAIQIMEKHYKIKSPKPPSNKKNSPTENDSQHP